MEGGGCHHPFSDLTIAKFLNGLQQKKTFITLKGWSPLLSPFQRSYHCQIYVSSISFLEKDLQHIEEGGALPCSHSLSDLTFTEYLSPAFHEKSSIALEGRTSQSDLDDVALHQIENRMHQVNICSRFKASITTEQGVPSKKRSR